MQQPASLDRQSVSVPRRLSRSAQVSGDAAERSISPALRLATLFGSERAEHVAQAVQSLMTRIGATLDLQHLSASLARAGTIGRIGVPRAAATLMYAQCVMLGHSFGAAPLAPVTRLWRGLQRRADVLLDVRQSLTMPGSAAALAGMHRDVLLVSHRVVDRAVVPSTDDAHHADQWIRAREAAEIVHRVAAAEERDLLLVLPVGRSTLTHQLFSDAIERHARLHRLPAPRTVKAGLLAALLSGDSGGTRAVVASVMPIDELSALATEAIGDTGPWPVMSLGRNVAFYDIPADLHDGDMARSMLLVMASMLARNGRAAHAHALLQSLHVTSTAAARMREELGGVLRVPADAMLSGVLANWGRVDSAEEAGAGGTGNRVYRRVLDPSFGRDRVELLRDAG